MNIKSFQTSNTTDIEIDKYYKHYKLITNRIFLFCLDILFEGFFISLKTTLNIFLEKYNVKNVIILFIWKNVKI